ncbi:MAG: hypothetical protein ACTSQP_11870 [Promethearchaeota archaeon]
MSDKINYEQLKKTDFFNFFNLSEIDRKIENDFLLISLKPGGFQEFIDIQLKLYKNDIIEAKLSLDRSWIGDSNSINPFAKDIAKSFIGALFPDKIDEEFKISLVQAIWNTKGSEDLVICLDKAIKNWESSDPDIERYLKTFRGEIIRHECRFGVFFISFENKINIENQKNLLEIILNWSKP